jgi:hypothetical protein
MIFFVRFHYFIHVSKLKVGIGEAVAIVITTVRISNIEVLL